MFTSRVSCKSRTARPRRSSGRSSCGCWDPCCCASALSCCDHSKGPLAPSATVEMQDARALLYLVPPHGCIVFVGSRGAVFVPDPLCLASAHGHARHELVVRPCDLRRVCVCAPARKTRGSE
eukprot:363124-Prymnesium_polylepis.1